MRKKHYYLTIPVLKRITGVLVLFFFAALVCGCIQDSENNPTVRANISQNKIIFNDTYGNRIELPHTASRIIAFQIDIVDMLVTIGAADTIIAIDTQASWRSDIVSKLSPDIKNVGSYSPLNIERIPELKPDVMVIYGYSLPQNMDMIRTLNVTIVQADCHMLSNLNRDAYVLGELTGNQEGARKYIEFNQKYMALVESRLTNLTPDESPDVYGALKTSSGADYVRTRNCSFTYLMTALHARNVNGNLIGYNAAANPEWIFQKDPDMVFILGNWGQDRARYEIGADSLRSVKENFKKRPGYENLKAVKSDRIYVYNLRLISGPRGVVGLIYFAKAIYPDRFADIDPDAVRREYAQEFGLGDEPAVEWFYPLFEPVNATSMRNTNELLAR